MQGINITYSEKDGLQAVENIWNNDGEKKELEKIYVDYSDRFSFKIFVKYFILGLLDKRCKKCGRLLRCRYRKKYNF